MGRAELGFLGASLSANKSIGQASFHPFARVTAVSRAKPSPRSDSFTRGGEGNRYKRADRQRHEVRRYAMRAMHRRCSTATRAGAVTRSLPSSAADGGEVGRVVRRAQSVGPPMDGAYLSIWPRFRGSGFQSRSGSEWRGSSPTPPSCLAAPYCCALHEDIILQTSRGRHREETACAVHLPVL